MSPQSPDFPNRFLAQARHSLQAHHLPRIQHCLKMLSRNQIWWRPNPASNSVGNLVLHLEGNVRQWIISGLGGAPDRRERDKEFAARGPLPRRTLLARLTRTVSQACSVLDGLAGLKLARFYSIQGFRMTGFEAVSHVIEHFAFHSGQIIYVTKLKRGQDLRFTRLPGEKRKARAKDLPTV